MHSVGLGYTRGVEYRWFTLCSQPKIKAHKSIHSSYFSEDSVYHGLDAPLDKYCGIVLVF